MPQLLLLKKRPYNLFIFSFIILSGLSLLKWERYFDIQVHDTLFVIAGPVVMLSAAMVGLFFWIIYLATRKIHWSITLSWYHTIATLLFIIIILTSHFWEGYLSNKSPSATIGIDNYLAFRRHEIITTIILIFLLITGQLSLVINLFKGFLKRRKRYLLQSRFHKPDLAEK